MATVSQHQYKEPSPLKISTYTMVCNINSSIDLNILSRCIPIYEPNDPGTDTKDGTFISISTYSASSLTDMPRGKLSSDKLPNRVFNNEITLLYKYWGFKKINLKIFTNGMLQMTGIINPDWETEHLATKLINTLKTLKYKIYINKIIHSIHSDYCICWNNEQQKLEYWRRNIKSYNPDTILEKGLVYDFSNTEWLVQTQVITVLNEYITKIDSEIQLLDTLRMELLNTYTYNTDARNAIFARLIKYKKVAKIEKDYVSIDNESYMKISIATVGNIIKFYKAFKLRLNQLLNADNTFINNVNTTYSDTLLSLITDAVRTGTTFIELDSPLSLCTTYNLSNVAIELINSDYNTRFNNNLVKIQELLSGPEYNIYCTYKPDEKYAGIIAKFMYNPAYLDSTKYKLGKCYCSNSCVTSTTPICVPISISIFRPGSIIITAAKEIKQLLCVYSYLNNIFKKHFSLISYVDIHDERDHFLLNEERYIMRKEHLVYAKRSSIKY